MDRAERDVRRMEGIICAMTPLERRKPDLIKATRKRRIAAGAGVQVQEVNRLLNQFEQMQDMMKKMKGGGMMKMMKRMGGDEGGRADGRVRGRAQRGTRASIAAFVAMVTPWRRSVTEDVAAASMLSEDRSACRSNVCCSSRLPLLRCVGGFCAARAAGAAADAEAAQRERDGLDTVAAWPPEATRVLTTRERAAYERAASRRCPTT